MKWLTLIILLIYIASVFAIPIDLNKEEITLHKDNSEITFQYFGFSYKLSLQVQLSSVLFNINSYQFTLTPQSSHQLDLDEDAKKDIEVYLIKIQNEKAYIKIILLEQLDKEAKKPPVTPPSEDEAPATLENVQGVLKGLTYATSAVQLYTGKKTMTGIGFSLALSEGIERLQESRPKAATALSVIQALDGLKDAGSSPRAEKSKVTGKLILDPDQLTNTIFILNDQTGELGITGYGTDDLDSICKKKSHIRNSEIYKQISEDKIKIVFATDSSKLRLENNNIQNLRPGSYVDLNKDCQIIAMVAKAQQDTSIKIKNSDFTLKQNGKLAYEQKQDYDSISLSDGYLKTPPKSITIGNFKAISKNPKLDLSVIYKQPPKHSEITFQNKKIFTLFNIPSFKATQSLIQEEPTFALLDNIVLFPKKQLNLFLENYDTTFLSDKGQITLQTKDKEILYITPKNKISINKEAPQNLLSNIEAKTETFKNTLSTLT